ncbi:MAG TPA: efflux transporter outer membrane subunit [Xanthobacteraceae bacterium]|nr:efflux transporter outer membrane subunit [Xanthobacteraceae bacterium]
MSRLQGLAGAVLVAFMQTSCAVGPDFHAPEAPGVNTFLQGRPDDPARTDRVPGIALVRGADIPPQWWELFHQPALDQLVEEGIAHNADLEAAEAALRVAQANALATRGVLLPTASAGFNASRQQTPTQALSSNATSGASIYSLYTPQVSVAYVADLWGGTRRQIETADAQAEALRFQREGVYLTLTTNIALAAIEEARLRGQIAATQRIIGLQSELLRILRRQNEQGQIALPDVVAQETAVAQARLLLPPLERQLAQQRNLLAFLTGRFPSEYGIPTFALGAFRAPRQIPLSLPADLVRQRPDIRTAEANLHAANAQIGVAIANRLPQIAITGNAGNTATSMAQLFAPGTGIWMIAGNAAQTVFDAGTLQNKQLAAEEATNQALAQYKSVVLAAFQNVADVLRALQADNRTIAAAVAAERSASQNIGLVRRQVEQGQASVPILLAAQQAYLQTSLARVDAQAARLADTVALFQALGGGWWNRLEVIAAGTAF